jgi:acetyl-CoA acyltransferase 1
MASPNRRLETIAKQFTAPSSSVSQLAFEPTAAAGKQSDDDVVIVAALRTAITKARTGDFATTYVEEMLAPVLKAVVQKAKIDPALVGDIVVGTVLGNGSQRANECRMASFLAGFPETVPIHTVNRQCSSGLQALAHVAANIKAGYYDIGIGAGLESMSQAQFKWTGSVNPRLAANKQAQACLVPMGITSENVASKYNVTRQEQDELAVRSHQRAAAAIKSGKFKAEIVPVETTVKDPKTGEERKVVVDTDSGVRANTNFEGLQKLKPAFKENGTTTAGNSSQVSDGAAAVLAMRRSTAKKLGVPILATFRSFAVTGVDPLVMGIGPATAIPEAVKKAGLSIGDIDLFEINEAFASQATYCVKKLGLSWDKVNVNGGAIALGHPLGATGARQVATLLSEMGRRKSKYGVISMCIGSGMGAAAVFEYTA